MAKVPLRKKHNKNSTKKAEKLKQKQEGCDAHGRAVAHDRRLWHVLGPQRRRSPALPGRQSLERERERERER